VKGLHSNQFDTSTANAIKNDPHDLNKDTGFNFMKLHLDTSHHYYQIQCYTEESITINDKIYPHSLIVMPTSLKEWVVLNFDSLTTHDFDLLAQLQPQVVLLGTGAKIRFPPAELLIPLIQQQIGIEVMDTAAACRTYNLLVSEGRMVAAALLLK
jgi:uncharacterized protein